MVIIKKTTEKKIPLSIKSDIPLYLRGLNGKKPSCPSRLVLHTVTRGAEAV